MKKGQYKNFNYREKQNLNSLILIFKFIVQLIRYNINTVKILKMRIKKNMSLPLEILGPIVLIENYGFGPFLFNFFNVTEMHLISTYEKSHV